MSEPVIAREVAEATVAGWEEDFGVTLEADSRGAVLHSVMAGRLTLGDAEEFTYRLRRPIALENGEKITELKLHEPTAGQLRDAAKGKRDDLDTSMRIISFVTGCPVIDRIGQKDLLALAALIGFFG